MDTASTRLPGLTQVLTSNNPNIVSVPQVPLPTVHHHSLRDDGKSNAAPASATVPAPEKENVTINNKKRKSDSGDTLNAAVGDTDNSKAKKPRTSRSKKSDEGSTKASSKKSAADALFDVNSIDLDEESLERIPVYETCTSIRRMIKDVLKKDGVTKAGFCRALAQATTALKKPPQGVQLSRFMDGDDAMDGNTNIVFYASYVLFEKMRIRDGKPKSKFRQEMEGIYGAEGVDIERNGNTQYITLHVSEKARLNKYGQLQIAKKWEVFD